LKEGPRHRKKKKGGPQGQRQAPPPRLSSPIDCRGAIHLECRMFVGGRTRGGGGGGPCIRLHMRKGQRFHMLDRVGRYVLLGYPYSCPSRTSGTHLAHRRRFAGERGRSARLPARMWVKGRGSIGGACRWGPSRRFSTRFSDMARAIGRNSGGNPNNRIVSSVGQSQRAKRGPAVLGGHCGFKKAPPYHAGFQGQIGLWPARSPGWGRNGWGGMAGVPMDQAPGGSRQAPILFLLFFFFLIPEWTEGGLARAGLCSVSCGSWCVGRGLQ